jgi:hypothetical protein
MRGLRFQPAALTPSRRRGVRSSRSSTAVSAMLVGLLIVTVAACGGGSPTSSPTTGATGSTTSSGHQGSSQIVFSSYSATVRERSARFAAVIRVRSSSLPASKITMTGASELSGRSERLRARATIPRFGTIKIRVVRGVEYVALPPSQAAAVSGGKRWISISSGQATGGSLAALQSTSAGNPSSSLSVLEASSSTVTQVGTEKIRGVKTTEYGAVLDLSKASNHVPPRAKRALARAAATLHTSTLPIDVWLDSENRVRRMSMKYVLPAGSPSGSGQSNASPVAVHLVMDVFGYGVRVVVSPPPASEVSPAPTGAVGPTG